jgi:Domain of unknown function (DUF4388)
MNRILTTETETPGLLTSLDGDFDAADLCLLGTLSGAAGAIQAGRNGSRGFLVLADGALVHASTGAIQGLAAFKQILHWKQLDFDWMPPSAAGGLAQNVRLDAAWLLKIATWRQHPETGVPETCKAEGLLSGIHLADLLSLLEKKEETGTLTVTAADHFGLLLLHGGRIAQADTAEDHGEKAIEAIRSWNNLRVTYSRNALSPPVNGSAASAPRSRGRGTYAMADLTKLIDELTGEVTEVLCTGIVRLDDGRALIENAKDPVFTASIASYAAVVKSHLAAAELLGGPALGETEDLLITLGRAYLLIRMLGTNHFHALFLARSANPAFGRALMRSYEPLFLAALPART